MKLVKRNQKLHNPDSPLLVGDVNDSDVVREVNEPSFIDAQTTLFSFYRNVFIMRMSKILLQF